MGGGSVWAIKTSSTNFADSLTCHPFGMSSERGILSDRGTWQAVSLDRAQQASRPSSVARNRSKSTNQLWNSARAIALQRRGSFRRFNLDLVVQAPKQPPRWLVARRGW